MYLCILFRILVDTYNMFSETGSRALLQSSSSHTRPYQLALKFAARRVEYFRAIIIIIIIIIKTRPFYDSRSLRVSRGLRKKKL